MVVQTQTLEQIATENLGPEWKFPHRLYAAVAALMVKDAKQGSKSHFSINDVKAYVFRAYNSQSAETFFAGSSPFELVEGEGAAFADEARIVKELVAEAKKEKPALTDDDLERLTALEGNTRYKKGGEKVHLLGTHIGLDAQKVFNYFKQKGTRNNPDLPYLDLREFVKQLAASNITVTAYKLVF